MKIKVILTGATGLVGEGVLLECLEHPDVQQVLMVNRRPSELKHPKLKECIVPDFFKLEGIEDPLQHHHLFETLRAGLLREKDLSRPTVSNLAQDRVSGVLAQDARSSPGSSPPRRRRFGTRCCENRRLKSDVLNRRLESERFFAARGFGMRETS